MQTAQGRERFLNGNKSIPTWNSQSTCSPEDLEFRVNEIAKCKKDPVYFAENYFYIINMDQGKQIIKLYPKQRELLKAFVRENRVIVNASRQSGKCVFKDSSIRVLNKRTGATQAITISQFHDMVNNTITS